MIESNNTKRHRMQKKSSAGLTLLIITINLWALYLFLNDDFFIYLAIAFSILTIIPYIVKFTRKDEKKDLITKRGIENTSRMIRKYLKINRKFIIVITLGVIISTTIISQSYLLSSAYSEQVFDNYFGSFGVPPAISFTITDDASNFDNLSQILPNINPGIQAEFDSKGVSFDRAEIHPFMYIIENGSDSEFGGWITNRLMTFDEETYNLLTNFPSFNEDQIPYDQAATYMFYNFRDVDNYGAIINKNVQEKEVTIIIREDKEEQNAKNMTIPIDYFWVQTEEDRMYYYDHDLYNNEYINHIISGSLIVNNTRQRQIVNDFLQLISDQEAKQISIVVQFYALIDNIKKIDLDELMLDLEKLTRSIESILRASPYEYRYIDSPLYWGIQRYQDDALTMNYMMILLMIPMISLSIFLVYFSLTLIEQRKKRLLAMMKIRGTSEEQMRILLNSEVLTTSLIALVSGMVLSIPYTLYTLSRMNQFEIDFTLLTLNIPETWYWKLPLIAIILTFDMNISSIISLSRVKIDDAEITVQDKTPLWQRVYLDLVFFAISSLFWLIIYIYPFDPSVNQLLVYNIGPIALILQIISTPLVIARYFSQFIIIISDLLWKINGGLIALATRNLKRNKFTASRLTALLTIGIMLSTLAIIVPHTITANSRREAEYRLGADIVLTGIDHNNSTQMKSIQIDGIEAYTEIAKVNIYNPLPGEGVGRDIGEYSFFGINKTSISDVLNWQDDYAEQSFETIVSSLNNRSIGLQSMEIIGLGIENTRELSLQMSESVTEIFDVVSEFLYFPHHVNTIPRQSYYGDGNYYFDSLSIVATYELVKEMANNFGNPIYEVLINVEDNANITKIAEQIRDIDNNFIVSTQDDYVDRNIAMLEIVLVFSFLENMRLITMLVSAMAVLYFSFMTLTERRKEIGVFRSVGMIRKQIFLLLIIESAILMIVSLVSGELLGYFITTNFFQLFVVDPYIIPKFKIFIPWIDILGFILIMISLILVASAIPSYLISRKQTGSILRAD